MAKNILCCYFSGTANTELVVRSLQKALQNSGACCTLLKMEDVLLGRKDFPAQIFDMIGFASPIHSGELPKIVHQFLRFLPVRENQKAFVLKTAAGIMSGINAAASARLIKKLARKNYQVFYDRTISMPSNWLVATDRGIASRLYVIAQQKSVNMADELMREIERLPQIPFLSRLLIALILPGYRISTPLIGKDIKVNNKCNNCGKCARECPTANIMIKSGRPRFRWRCISCMRCLYFCPQNALDYRIFKAFKLKEGYNIRALIRESDHDTWPLPQEDKLPENFVSYQQDASL